MVFSVTGASMTQLKGFLWSMGRGATKAVSSTLQACTGIDALDWVDSRVLVQCPQFASHALRRPCVLTLHHPELLQLYAKMLSEKPGIPVVLTFRDPIANLESYAQTFLTSFIARRIDEVEKFVAQGGEAHRMINPKALEEWLLPACNLEAQYLAVKGSPHMIVDFAELSKNQFQSTIRRICRFFDLKVQVGPDWAGEANTECDRFLIGYRRTFRILDRSLELSFTRWKDFWVEPGQLSLGTLRSAHLTAWLGTDQPLYVFGRSDQLMGEGRLDMEREAFASLLAETSIADAIAKQLVSDSQRTVAAVKPALHGLQAQLLAQFLSQHNPGIMRLVKTCPGIDTHWTQWKDVMRKAA